MKWVDWIASGPKARTKLHAVEDVNDTHTLCGARIVAGKQFHRRPEPFNLTLRGNPVGTCYWCWMKAPL